jgi:hypothetical protein
LSGRAFSRLPLDKKPEIELDKHNVGYLSMRGDTLRTYTIATVTKPMSTRRSLSRDLPAGHPHVLAVWRFHSANGWPTDQPGFR